MITKLVTEYFDLEKAGTTLQREFAAGLTTFFTMSYIIVVNPAILKAAGIPEGPSMVATVAIAILGSLLMGLYANLPFAIAPYMGENAFISYTVVRALGYRWETALGAVFIAGAVFTLLTIGRVREWMADAVPEALRHSFAAGIGLFMAFVGLNECGIVTIGALGAPVRVGNLASPSVMVAVAGFILIAMLMLWRIPASILAGILLTSATAFVVKVAPLPTALIGVPPSPLPIFFKLDFHGALSWGFFGVSLTIFVMAFCDTTGTLLGVAQSGNLLDRHGNLPRIERPMLVDALATTVAALAGTTTAGAYIESAAGVAVGGRTGLTAVVTAALFALSLFMTPLMTAIPREAYGPAMIAVGLMMLAPITRINFTDLTEALPAFAVVSLMSFTYNIGIGVTAGFILYPLFKLGAGRANEVKPGLLTLAGLSLLFFVFFPYH
jgi:AGZA family xanthine/uracil permease-like MFS transporter